MKRVLLITLILVLGSCSLKPAPPPPDAPTVYESYQAAMHDNTDHIVHEGSITDPNSTKSNLIKPKKILIPSMNGVILNPDLTKEQADFNANFPMLPNPQILLYIYPHFQNGLPVHGTYTTMSMYKNNHYALPSEVLTGLNSKVYQ
ncbi:hypothetical protein [Francisella sp. SYW-9]|uniref:hypothetical protein n=1 Tax=Francisella sp. SYW-9 TaxID=2610888 RepID=UPI00123D16A6|nr:hypothetical protein [Francisella sp. SYW-9]